MQSIGDVLKNLWDDCSGIKAKFADFSWEPARWLELGREWLDHRPWLSGTLAVMLLMLGGLAVCWPEQTAGENSAGGNRNITHDTGTLMAKEGQRLEIKGLEEAAQAKTLRNPFTPDHTSISKAGVGKQPEKKSAVHKGSVKAKEGQKQAGSEVSSAQNTQSKQNKIYLQGIIDMDGHPGVLLRMGEEDKFLLAGDSWQGYIFEGIENDNVILSGHRLNVGEALMM